MKRRSFVASLFASIAAIPFNPIKAFAKPKVQPFWDWTCTLRLADGKTVRHTVHTYPRVEAPSEITYDGRHFNKVSSNLHKRRLVYRETPTLDATIAKGWRMYIERTEKALV